MTKAWLFLRAVAYLLWLTVTVIPYASAVLVVSIFIRGTPLYWMCAFWLGMATWGARFFLGIRYRVSGLDQLPKAPLMLLSKHQSAWETLAYPSIMPNPLSYVFKRELLYVPFFGWSMARLDMVHIDRGRVTQAWAKVARQGKQFLAQGNWVIMFPEGTRMPRGTQGQYKTGGTRLAIQAGVPVVPIAVTSAKCWPKGSFIKFPGIIDVSIGSPIPSVGRRPDELMREVETWIEAEMHRLDPAAYPSVGTDTSGSTASAGAAAVTH
jgi:1-acyl-sn-glycerol-3-phosphate acyltransferase